MDRRAFIERIAGALVAVPVAAAAQPVQRVARIGFLLALDRAAIADRIEAFRAGLRDLGYVEDRDVVIEYRFAHGRLERLPDLAADLVRSKVDIIVTGGPAATRPAMAATATIPIVMGMDNDPVASGFVASLARPGGNVTGVSTLVPALSGKQIEILREILPRLSHVGVLGSSNEPGNPQQLDEAVRAAKAVDLRLTYADVLDGKDVEPGFRALVEARVGALLVLTSPILTFRRDRLAQLALGARVPSIFAHPEAVRSGGLVTYGVHLPELFRRAAGYVDRILKGGAPAEMAIEQPTRFELVVNLRTARTLGVSIPQSLLLRADEVIQ